LERYGAIYRAAAVRLCISPGLRDWFERRFGVTGVVLYPNRSERLRPRALERNSTLIDPRGLTLGYAGGLSYGYGEALRELVPVLSRASVRLRVYSRDDPGRSVPGCEYAGSWPPDQAWERVKAECDAVLLPYSFRDVHRGLY